MTAKHTKKKLKCFFYAKKLQQRLHFLCIALYAYFIYPNFMFFRLFFMLPVLVDLYCHYNQKKNQTKQSYSSFGVHK